MAIWISEHFHHFLAKRNSLGFAFSPPNPKPSSSSPSVVQVATCWTGIGLRTAWHWTACWAKVSPIRRDHVRVREHTRHRGKKRRDGAAPTQRLEAVLEDSRSPCRLLAPDHPQMERVPIPTSDFAVVIVVLALYTLFHSNSPATLRQTRFASSQRHVSANSPPTPRWCVYGLPPRLVKLGDLEHSNLVGPVKSLLGPVFPCDSQPKVLHGSWIYRFRTAHFFLKQWFYAYRRTVWTLYMILYVCIYVCDIHKFMVLSILTYLLASLALALCSWLLFFWNEDPGGLWRHPWAVPGFAASLRTFWLLGRLGHRFEPTESAPVSVNAFVIRVKAPDLGEG